MKLINRRLCLTIFICLCLTGCSHSNNRAIWSPDESKLGIIAADGFRLCSKSGELSELLIQKKIGLFSWFADSKKVAVVSEESILNWSDLKIKLTKEEVQQVVGEGAKLMEALCSYHGDPNKFWDSTPSLHSLSKISEAFLYIKQEYKDELKRMAKEKWKLKEVEETTVTVRNIETYGLEQNIETTLPLYQTTNDILEMRVSPDGKTIAFVEGLNSLGDSQQDAHTLRVLPVGGGSPLTISTHSSDYPDWSHDGKSLLFCETQIPSTSNDKSLSNLDFGAIKQIEVCDKNGNLKDKIENSQLLAYVKFSANIRIRCLKDGTVLFSASELQLPATLNDTNCGDRLFAVKSGLIPTIVRLNPHSTETELGNNTIFNLYEPSPDGHFAAIPKSDGSINILDLRTGMLQTPQTGNLEAPGQLDLLPQWKNSDELSFEARVNGKPKSKHKADIVL